MVRRPENLFQRGPVIRDLSVPDEELVLKPGRLRAIRRRRRTGGLLRRLYGTALTAWTLGLVAASAGMLLNGGARSGGDDTALPVVFAEVAVPLPEAAIPFETYGLREVGPP